MNKDKHLIVFLPIAILLLGSILHYARGYYGLGETSLLNKGVDDAYITYRYGWNLTKSGILSWNESGFRRTEGFTNPLWMLASAAWSLPGSKDLVYPLAVISSLVISGILFYILIESVFERYGKSPVSIMGLVMVAFVPALWLHFTAGLESGVFGLGLATLAYLALFNNSRYAGPVPVFILTLFLGLLRSDGFIYLGIILIAALLAGSRIWKTLALGIAVSILSLFTWRFLSFGQLLPNTATAKLNFGIIERAFVGAQFLKATLLNSGLIIFILFGVAGLWIEPRRKGLAGVFIIITWITYYLYIGGDIYFERHLIGLYFLTAAFSAPLWLAAKPATRILYFVVVIGVIVVSIRSFGNRFTYLTPKPNDPWVMLGKAVEEDREKYGVVITFAAGKIPFYAGGDFIDSIGLNDPYLATLKRDGFVPGHSAGSENEAVDLVRSHPAGVYSMFSYLDESFIKQPDDIGLWVDNYNPQEKPQIYVSEEEWQAAKATDNIFIWSIISKPIRVMNEN
jgi:hypothetical protein